MTDAKESIVYNKEWYEGKIAATEERYQFLKNKFDSQSKNRRNVEEENFASEVLIGKLNDDLDNMHAEKMKLEHDMDELRDKMKE